MDYFLNDKNLKITPQSNLEPQQTFNNYVYDRKEVTECADHRTINLFAHATKLLWRVVGKRLEKKVEYFKGKHSLDSKKDVGLEKQ